MILQWIGYIVIGLAAIYIPLFLLGARPKFMRRKRPLYQTVEQQRISVELAAQTDQEARIREIAQDEAIGIAMWDTPRRK